MATKKKVLKKKSKAKTLKPLKPLASIPVAHTTDNIELQDITATNSKEYGSYVVEQRAIPDFRDGLKPVHRAALWAMYKNHMHHNTAFKKSARVVGDVIGKYHPHGDTAAYGAMVTIANNTMPNLIEGQGNWGDHVDNAAAQRYTECRLSKFSDLFLLDRTYLNVVPMVPNFDGEETMPLFLPALLPVQLLCGSPTMPAYGVSAGTPSFHIEGITKLVEAVLKGKKISSKSCTKHLKIHFRFGGELLSGEEDIQTLMETGKGSLKYLPTHGVSDNYKEVHVSSCCPGFSSDASISKTLERISNIEGIAGIRDDSDSKAGKFGIKYVITLKRMSEEKVEDVLEKVEKCLSGSASWHIGFTHRKRTGTSFGRSNVPDFIKRWVKYRIGLESAVIKYLIKEERKKLERQELLLWGTQHIDDIADSLKDKKNGPHKHLAKVWKDKTEEFIVDVLKLQVYRLAALEIDEIKEKIVTHTKEIKSLKVDLKAPSARILRTFRPTVNAYIKETRKLNQHKDFKGDRIEN
jgi:DNA gyrase subunit A